MVEKIMVEKINGQPDDINHNKFIKLLETTITKIDAIDLVTPWVNNQPPWYLEMMCIRRRLAKSIKQKASG